MYSYLGALLLLCFTTLSSAYLDGAQSESCYDHLITHVTTVRGVNVTSLSEECSPCSYTLEVLGRVMDDGGLDPTDFANTTMTNLRFQYNKTYKLLLERGINGFLGFLVQARESDSTMFNSAYPIIGFFDDTKPLYKALRCKNTSMSSGAPVPNSATHRDSDDFRGMGTPGQVELYWTTPVEGEMNISITFWFTIVQQHLTHFFPVRGPSGILMPDPPAVLRPSTTSFPSMSPTNPPPSPTATSAMIPSSTTSSTNTMISSSTTPPPTTTPPPIGSTFPSVTVMLSEIQIAGIGVGGGLAVILLIAVIVLVIAIVAVKCRNSGKREKSSRASVLWTTNPTTEDQLVEIEKEKSGLGVEYNPNGEKATID